MSFVLVGILLLYLRGSWCDVRIFLTLTLALLFRNFLVSVLFLRVLEFSVFLFPGLKTVVACFLLLATF